MSLQPLTGAQRLRQLLKDPNHIVVCPGVFDGITARIALNVGFEALYMTGAGTSMSKLGWADLGIATLDTMRTNAEMLSSLNPSIPIIADADTGYGGPIMVSRTVTQYARSGVAALHIEDQAQQKRCGHLLGKVIVPREEYYARLRAAVSARDAIGSEMLIIARTDARQTYGFDEAMERLRYAVEEIGVDVVFFEAMSSEEEARRVCEAFKGITPKRTAGAAANGNGTGNGSGSTGTPVLLNMVAGGVTPNMDAAKAKEIGFRIVIFPGVCIGPIVKAVEGELQYLKKAGDVSEANGREGVVKAFTLCGMEECVQIDKDAGGKAYDTVSES